MDLHLSDKWVREVIGVALAVVILIVLLSAFVSIQKDDVRTLSRSLVTQTTPPTPPIQKVLPGLPARLIIPKIHVDAKVESVGTTSTGAMGAPKGPDDVAWFNRGPVPGDEGSAVISGHSGWVGGRAAAFDTLNELRKGDTLYVVDERGATSTYVVREIKTFGEYADASSVFYSNDGKAHLNLVTCEGVWDSVKQSYADRLLVFTDKI